MSKTDPNLSRKAIRIDHQGREVVIVRDEQGVPHVHAGRWLDVLFGLGYMHALDRTTQVLFSRAVASGRGAERIADKPELVETDRFFRRVGLHRHLDDEVAALDELLLPVGPHLGERDLEVGVGGGRAQPEVDAA